MTDPQKWVELDWLQSGSGDRLHYAPLSEDEALDLEAEGYIDGLTVFACGRSSPWTQIPGVFTRMGAMRCQRCCDALGYPRGRGSPKNDEATRPLVLVRIG